MATCPDCNEEIKGNPAWHAKKHASSVAVAERPEGPRSRKGRERRQIAVLSPLEQIRPLPAGTTGASAYYLRPGGATIRDVLIISPNGGIPENADPRMRARFGMNHELYRAKALQKGHVFLGTKLDQRAVRMIVEEMAKNRQEAIWEMEDEIDECDQVIQNSDKPDIRDLYKRRKAAATTRKATLEAKFDPDALVAELDEISRAQRLAGIDPNILAVMREMIGDVNEKMVAHFSAPRDKHMVRGGGQADTDFQGQDFIDADN